MYIFVNGMKNQSMMTKNISTYCAIFLRFVTMCVKLHFSRILLKFLFLSNPHVFNFQCLLNTFYSFLYSVSIRIFNILYNFSNFRNYYFFLFLHSHLKQNNLIYSIIILFSSVKQQKSTKLDITA